MQVTSSTSPRATQVAVPEPTRKEQAARLAFEDMGKALDSGNLANAQTALEKLKVNAPVRVGRTNNPIADKADALSKALESGDLTSAQSAYADLKHVLAQRPAAARRPVDRPSRPAATQAPAEGTAPGNTAKAQLALFDPAQPPTPVARLKDPRDTNKDDEVSAQEILSYQAAHPSDQSKSATEGHPETKGYSIDTMA